jgi:predicted transcriptional regulator
MLSGDLRLPPELEARVEAAARAAGRSPQELVVEAVEAYFTGASQDSAAFVAEALDARKEFERTGLAYDADEVFEYLLERASGKNPTPPALKQWSA